MEVAQRHAAAALMLVLLCASASALRIGGGEKKKRDPVLYEKKFRSKPFVMRPGDVINRYDVADMPKGEVALKSLNAEVVDEYGNGVPLYDTYLHHWAFLKYYVKEGGDFMVEEDRILIPNDGPCRGGANRNSQWFGIGSETRHTNYTVPPPYGIVIGDKGIVPPGYEEVWILNTHAIDTRHAVDKRLCLECQCAAYNRTEYPKGGPLPEDYHGGLYCCESGYRCALQDEYKGDDIPRTIYLDYTVTWLEALDDVIPVNVYILDSSDPRTAFEQRSDCKVEYQVPKCPEGTNKEECIHIRESYAFLPEGGDVIYAVAHQHLGGIGYSVHKEDGQSICTSLPVYGRSDKVGDELGYIVGMETCYPEPGSVKVGRGEKLTIKSYYENTEEHTGVMGLYYMMVAPDATESKLRMRSDDVKEIVSFTPMAIVLLAVILVAASFFVYNMIKKGGNSYTAIPDTGVY